MKGFAVLHRKISFGRAIVAWRRFSREMSVMSLLGVRLASFSCVQLRATTKRLKKSWQRAQSIASGLHATQHNSLKRYMYCFMYGRWRAANRGNYRDTTLPLSYESSFSHSLTDKRERNRNQKESHPGIRVHCPNLALLLDLPVFPYHVFRFDLVLRFEFQS